MPLGHINRTCGSACLQEAVLSPLSCTALEGLLEADLQQEAHRLHSQLQASSAGANQAVVPDLSHMLLLPKLQQLIMEQRAPPEMDQGERLVLATSWNWPVIFQARTSSSAFSRLRAYLRDTRYAAGAVNQDLPEDICTALDAQRQASSSAAPPWASAVLAAADCVHYREACSTGPPGRSLMGATCTQEADRSAEYVCRPLQSLSGPQLCAVCAG